MKRRKDPFKRFFEEFMEDFDFDIDDYDLAEIGGGYSIRVEVDSNGLPKVHVKTFGSLDEDMLRKELRRKYGDKAKITFDSEKRSQAPIRVISEKEEKGESGKKVKITFDEKGKQVLRVTS